MAQIYIDAATKQHPNFSVGAIVIKENTKTIEDTIILGNIDNNEAEWKIFIAALKTCLTYGIKQALIYTDSQLVADSIQKEFVKDKRFRLYLNQYLEIKRHFDLILVSFIARENNKHADTLAKSRLYKELK